MTIEEFKNQNEVLLSELEKLSLIERNAFNDEYRQTKNAAIELSLLDQKIAIMKAKSDKEGISAIKYLMPILIICIGLILAEYLTSFQTPIFVNYILSIVMVLIFYKSVATRIFEVRITRIELAKHKIVISVDKPILWSFRKLIPLEEAYNADGRKRNKYLKARIALMEQMHYKYAVSKFVLGNENSIFKT